ncbi:hypothetical protein [Neobacillus jeddahensis]|uniref:hypothetical protein n=1 Tax=Neobacillus jeddahensis TaxID=1461580 RepID=UPI00058BA736|nr:hypothetical protein [Neobacillus jeddahensis]
MPITNRPINKGNTRNSTKYNRIKGRDQSRRSHIGEDVEIRLKRTSGRALAITRGGVKRLYDKIFEGMIVNQKEEISAFLRESRNVAITEQVRIAKFRTKNLFPNSQIKLELRPDYESGEDVLLFLIESHSELETDFAALHRLYEFVSLNDHFIVDLEFAQ